MIIAPPLDPSAAETKTQDVSAEKRCVAKFRNFKISSSFDISRSYLTISPDFGVIVRLDLEQADHNTFRTTARFMCWTDKESGDVVTAWAVGYKGKKLPE
jgi:hypothetical protein